MWQLEFLAFGKNKSENNCLLSRKGSVNTVCNDEPSAGDLENYMIKFFKC